MAYSSGKEYFESVTICVTAVSVALNCTLFEMSSWDPFSLQMGLGTGLHSIA